MGGFKDKIGSLLKINTPKYYSKQIVYGGGKKLSKPKLQKKSEENIIKSMRNLFILKKVIKDIKRLISN